MFYLVSSIVQLTGGYYITFSSVTDAAGDKGKLAERVPSSNNGR